MQKDLPQIAQTIQAIVEQIGSFRRQLEGLGGDKAQTLAQYDRKICTTLVGLREGESYKIGEKKIKQLPVSILDKVAKGICWEERLQMELAEAKYKACITNIEALKAQLNAQQSIYRHLDET